MTTRIALANFPRFSQDIWLPVLWANAKTYYEKHGQRGCHWIPAYFDVYDVEHQDQVKKLMLDQAPDILALSLYVWNYKFSLGIAEWVKTVMPNCVIVTGGPHQNFKHDMTWFQRHPYIDASLPGECYGELALTEIIDNYDQGHVDWDQVTDIRYPRGVTRQIACSPKTFSKKDKRGFDYEWAAFAEQHTAMQQFVDYKNQTQPHSRLMSIVETTRGCPYGCTYCDWGGGIATTVIKKSVNTVQRDIDSLAQLNLHMLYLADANFGIFGPRDVEIIKYIANTKLANGRNFKIFYGGFAKTENRLDEVKEIVEIDLDNHLSHHDEIKISIQSLDPTVLKNIDRVNIPYQRQLETFESIARNKKIPMYGEIILGLPGMTLDKFYYELGVFAQDSLSIQWYPWMLLPEAPAYAREYRTKFDLHTVIKEHGWSYDESAAEYEIVYQAQGYTADDYLQMMLSTGFYNLVVQGGYYCDTFKWIQQHHHVRLGIVIRNIFEKFFKSTNFYNQAHREWQTVLSDQHTRCAFTVGNQKVYGTWYFAALAFLEHHGFTLELMQWLRKTYKVPYNTLRSDEQRAVHAANFQTKQRSGLNIIDYRKPIITDDLDAVINLFILYRDSGSIFRGKKYILGLIPTQ